MDICELSEYVLLEIFKYCNGKDLDNLYFTCSLFQSIIDRRIYHTMCKSLAFCGQSCFKDRNFVLSTNREKLVIYRNRLQNIWERRPLIPARDYTKILLDKKFLYQSYRQYIRLFKRTNDIIDRPYIREICESSGTTITDFKIKGDSIFVGQISGEAVILKNGDSKKQLLHRTDSITSVDFLNNTYVTSSCVSCKLWSLNVECSLEHFGLIREYNLPCKKVCISNTGHVFCGKDTDPDNRALIEIELETGNYKSLNSHTPLVNDIKLKDENVLITANLCDIRLFDKRANGDQLCFPLDLYTRLPTDCLEYDGNNGVLCNNGTIGQISLFDIRVSSGQVMCHKISKHIQSIASDSRFLFFASEKDVEVLDFLICDKAPQDFPFIK